jgi:hypothetical protein
MKKLFILIFILSGVLGYSQEMTKVDTVAVNLLIKMSTVIGELTSVTFNLETANDKMNDLRENERHFSTHKIQMVGPDKMAVHSRGDSGNKAIWYNGEILTYYSFDENNYVSLEAPDNIIDMVDDINNRFGIDFPGADIFYPSLVDDVLENFEFVKYLGFKTVDEEECFHVMASNKHMTFQIWINNNAMFTPKRFLIIDKENGHKHYQGTFSNWNINPILPESMFNFRPPTSAKLISILAKS